MAERPHLAVPRLLGGAAGLLLPALLLWSVAGHRTPEPDRAPPPIPAPPMPAAPVATPAVEPVPTDWVHEELVENPAWTGDLDGMVKRRQIRILVVPNRTDYYLDRGASKGVTAEYAQALDRRLNRQLDTGARPIQVTYVPTARDELLPALVAGKGDIAAANLTVTPERLRLVDFSPPLLDDVREIVVTGPAAPPLASLDDLAGREIRTRRSSSYWTSLDALDGRLRARGLPGLRLRPVLEVVEDEDLLELVDAGLLPFAVVDDHKARAWAGALPRLRLHEGLAVRQGGRIAWAYRKQSPKLAAALAGFARATAKGTAFGNIVTDRYLVAAEQLRAGHPGDRDRFLDLLDRFRRAGERYRLDPLLLAAQGYQESGLDQGRRSAAGAIGIMQMRPATAHDPRIGITRLDRLDNNIEAGAKYLRLLVDDHFADPAIRELDRMLFALAAYNAGPARIDGLRDHAARRGLDPDRWFGQVELQAARELGRETVAYVGNVVKYYTVYRGIADQEEARHAARRLIVAR